MIIICCNLAVCHAGRSRGGPLRPLSFVRNTSTADQSDANLAYLVCLQSAMPPEHCTAYQEKKKVFQEPW